MNNNSERLERKLQSEVSLQRSWPSWNFWIEKQQNLKWTLPFGSDIILHPVSNQLLLDYVKWPKTRSLIYVAITTRFWNWRLTCMQCIIQDWWNWNWPTGSGADGESWRISFHVNDSKESQTNVALSFKMIRIFDIFQDLDWWNPNY